MSQFQKHSYWQCLASSISLSSKTFGNITFYEAENNDLLRQDDSPLKSLFTIWFSQGPEKYIFHKIMQQLVLTKFHGISKFMASDLQPLSTPILFLNTSGVNIMPEYVRILCQSMCEYAQICINGFSYMSPL